MEGQRLRAGSEVMTAKGFKKGGEPVWDQTTFDRLLGSTQQEAMIESGPPPTEKPQLFNASEHKAKKEEAKK